MVLAESSVASNASCDQCDHPTFTYCNEWTLTHWPDALIGRVHSDVLGHVISDVYHITCGLRMTSPRQGGVYDSAAVFSDNQSFDNRTVDPSCTL